MFATADLSDSHPDAAVLMLSLRPFARRKRFSGPIRTVHVADDNVLVKEAIEDIEPGSVLVINGGGSLRSALLGDRLAGIAADRAIAGVIVNGCVRDTEQLANLDVGILALGSSPRRSNKNGDGMRDVDLAFGGITFRSGDYLYADADGVIVSPIRLT